MEDVGVFLARDHAELDRLVMRLVSEPRATTTWRQALEAARLAFAAHVEAQDRALCVASSSLSRFVTTIAAAHRTQEDLLDRLLDENRSGTMVASDVLELRASLLSHDEQERLIVLPALRAAMPEHDYERLAASYATERLHALGSLWKVGPRPRETARV